MDAWDKRPIAVQISRPSELDLSGFMKSTAVMIETGIVLQNAVHVTNRS